MLIKNTLFQSTLHMDLSRKETGYTTLQVCVISSSSKGILNMALMDNHSPHITRWLKQTTMYVQLSEDFSSPHTSETPRPTMCITLCTPCPSRWIFQHIQHLQILQTNHRISSADAQNWEFENLSPPITLLGRYTKMAYRHNYHKKIMGNKAMWKSTNRGTDQTTGDSSPHHIYPKSHKISSPGK